MAVADYASLEELKAHLGETRDTYNDTLSLALNAAHGAVDSYVGRSFTKDSTATARTFTPRNVDRVTVDDFWTTTGLVIKTDHDFDLDYDITWDAADFVALRYPDHSDRPYNVIHGTRQRWFPANLRKAVQVTAQWGWPAVPPEVREATLLQAAYLYERRKAPAGVLGSEAAGFFEFRGKLDPDARGLLRAYRKRWPF